MTILCIETSTSVCSAALYQDGRVINRFISREGGNHAGLLPVFIDRLIHSGSAFTIDAVALSEGPGSYTGLRIGTSTAKGLCYGWQVPLLPVPTLQILSAAALASQSSIADSLLYPMIDARRMEVYTAVYDTALQNLTEVQAVVVDNSFADHQSSIFNLQSPIPYPRYYFGDGAAKCQTILTDQEWVYIPDIVPDAQYMGSLAERLFLLGKGLTANTLAYYEPFYLKDFVAAQSHVKGLV